MDYENYHIYVVEGAKQLTDAEALVKERKTKLRARHKYCVSQGGIGAVERRESMIGLLAKEGAKIADGWKRIDQTGWRFPPSLSYIPDRRTRRGREIVKEMLMHQSLGGGHLAERVGAPNRSELIWSGGHTYLCDVTAHQEGDRFIVLVPKMKTDKRAPKIPGLRHLKMSELYAIKEKAA